MKFLIKNMSIFAIVFLFLVDPVSASSDIEKINISHIKEKEMINYLDGVLFEDHSGNAKDLQNMTDGNSETRARIPLVRQGGDKGVSYTFEKSIDIKGYFYIIANTTGTLVFIDNNGKENEIEFKVVGNDEILEVDFKNVKKIKVTNNTHNYLFVSRLEVYGTLIEHEPVENLSVSNIKYHTADLSWKNPTSDKIEEIEIKKNGELLEVLSSNTEKYHLKDLKDNEEVNIEVIVKYSDGFKSRPTGLKFKTEKIVEELGEVKDLKAKATHEKVDLNWENPNQDSFKSVIIYREEIESTIKKLFGNITAVKKVYAADKDKLFETNGTYFIDHSVKPQKTYEYLVTTLSQDDVESKGIKTIVKTLKKPNPEPPKSEIEKDENGDYLLTWVSPKTGDVLIKINGKNYKRLKASAGSYLIPGEDMVYSILGNPKVELVAIDEDGDESSGIAPGPPGSTENGGSGGSSGGMGDLGDVGGIDAKDVLQGTMSFIRLMSPLILLGIIVLFVPRIIKVVKVSIGNNKQ